MSSDLYTIELASPGGERLAIADTFLSLDYTLATNAPGELTLVVPGSFNYKLLGPDARITLIRDGAIVGNTCWFIQESWINLDNGVYTIGVAAESALGLLRRRIVAYVDGSSQANKTAAADNMIKAVVRENLGASAVSARDLTPYLSVQADAGLAASLTMQFAWDNVLSIAQDIADATKDAALPAQWLYFDVELLDAISGGMEFRTFVGQRGNDHSLAGPRPVIFSPDNGNVTAAERRYDYRNEFNYVYAVAPMGDNTLYTSGGDTVRMARSLFGRRESMVRASSGDDPFNLIAPTLAAGRPRKRVTATIIDTPDVAYGRHWQHGDTVGLVFAGETGDYRINSLTGSVDASREDISVVLESDDVYA